jgi:dTMP kinase
MSDISRVNVLPWRPRPATGVLVTFCGIDGSGKSTLVRRSRAYLHGHGLATTVTRMPTKGIVKTPLVRQFLRDPDPAARAVIDYDAFTLAMMADRLQVLRGEILPALAAGGAVVCDRYVLQAVAGTRGRDIDDALVCSLVALFPAPTVGFFVDTPIEVCRRRVAQRASERNRYADWATLEKMVAAYRELAAHNGLHVVSGERPPAESFGAVRVHLDAAVGALASR